MRDEGECEKSNYGLIWQHILLSAGSLASLKINIMSERWGGRRRWRKDREGYREGVWSHSEHMECL